MAQGGDAILIRDVDIRAMLYQQPDDLLVPFTSVAEDDRLQQGRPAQIVYMFDIHVGMF